MLGVLNDSAKNIIKINVSQLNICTLLELNRRKVVN